MSSFSSDTATSLPNTTDPSTPILSVNMSGITKLTTTNYMSWSLQLRLFLGGHDLSAYIDESSAPPSRTITVANVVTANPKYTTWIRQDQLIFASLLGAISMPLQALVINASTTLEAWQILAKTYGTPSRGHIKQLKDQLKKTTKGTHTIDEYMQLMKSKADQLSLLGKPVDHEDLIEFIIDGLPEEYRAVSDAIQNRDTMVSFEEFHEKLRNREAAVICNMPILSSFPATAHAANTRSQSNHNWRPSPRPPHDTRSSDSRPHDPRSSSSGSDQRRPYLGRCQACGKQGHSAQRCFQYRLVQTQPQPRAHVATASSQENPSWLLDSGASHHITSDLQNLSLHASYSGSDNVVIGDGHGLPISHTCSTSLSSLSGFLFAGSAIIFSRRHGHFFPDRSATLTSLPCPGAELGSFAACYRGHVNRC